MATAQTGSGKTGAFMIPLVQKCLLAGRQKVFPTFGIVLAPSRELAEQIGSVGRAISKGTHVTVADTSQSEKTILSASIICGTPNKIIGLGAISPRTKVDSRKHCSLYKGSHSRATYFVTS